MGFQLRVMKFRTTHAGGWAMRMMKTAKVFLSIAMCLLFAQTLLAQGECTKIFNLPGNNWREHNIKWPAQASTVDGNSKLFTDQTGQVYYVGADGYVYNYFFDVISKKWDVQRLASQSVLVDPRGGMAFNNNGRVFVVGNDKKVYNFQWQNGAWQFSPLPGQSALTDARGGLVADPAQDKVFFIGTDAKGYYFYRQNNAWQFTLLAPPSALANPDGGMAYDPALSKLFVIGNNGKVYSYSQQNNAWVFGPLVAFQSVNANPAAKMVYDASLKRLFVVGVNGRVSNFYLGGSGWQFLILPAIGSYMPVQAAGGMAYDGGKVYIIGNDGKVYNHYQQNNNWYYDWLVSNPSANASAASGMSVRNGKIYVVGTDGLIYNYYWANGKWNFDALNPTQRYPARHSSGSVLTSDMNLFYTNDKGRLQELYYAGSQIDYQKWNLVYGEDFGTTSTTPLSLFLSDWEPRYPWGANQGGQIVANIAAETNVPSALSTSNSQLHLTANATTTQAPVIEWLPDNAILEDGKPNLRWFSYTSGAVSTKVAYTYGLFEISCRQPLGKGFWPAFWLYGQNRWPPEIDVLEGDGARPTYSSNNNVVTPTSGCFMYYYWNTGQDFTQGFHKYSVLWLPDRLIFYLDGNELRTIHDDIPDEPMHVILNLAIAGGAGGPTNATVFPSSFDIDYIRFYSLKP